MALHNTINVGDYFIYNGTLELCTGILENGWILEHGGFAPLNPAFCTRIDTKGFAIAPQSFPKKTTLWSLDDWMQDQEQEQRQIEITADLQREIDEYQQMAEDDRVFPI